MNILKAPIESVIPWDKNPRGIKTKDYERLKKQILKLGVYKPLIAFEDKGKYVVLGGNMRIRALKELGIKDVEISVVKPTSEAQKIEFALSDNDRVGFYEEDKLAELVYPHIKDIELGDFKVDLGEALDLRTVTERYGPGGFDVAESDIPDLPSGDRAPFQQMTFTLHDEQVEEVKAAVTKAKGEGHGVSAVNDNGNGNALAWVCDRFNRG